MTDYSLDSRENILRCRRDINFLEKVMKANDNLVWFSINKYIGNPNILTKDKSIDAEDLAQVGRIGLLKAIRAFDLDRGTKFSSYAVIAIVREVRDFMRNNASVIRPTRTAHSLKLKIKELEENLGYLPTVEEIAEVLGEDVEAVEKVLSVGQSVKYLHEPFSHLVSEIPLDNIVDEDKDIELEAVGKVYVDNLLESVKQVLSEEERRVLELKLKGCRHTEIAQKENLSPMRVSRIMKKIMTTIEQKTSL